MLVILKMLKRREFVVFVLVVYSISYFLILYPEPKRQSLCTYKDVCVRFCCDNYNFCSKKFIDANFGRSLIPVDDNSETKDFKKFFGKPNCAIVEPLRLNVPWRFDKYGNVLPVEATPENRFSYDSNEYCLEVKSDTESDIIGWDVFHCSSNNSLHKTLRTIFVSGSVVLFFATILVYVLTKSFHTVIDKCELLLLVGVFLFGFCYFWLSVVNYWEPLLLPFMASTLWTCLSVSVLTFDLWWTLKCQGKPEMISNGGKKFKFYCYYVFGVTALVLLVVLILGSFKRDHVDSYYFLGIAISLTVWFCFAALAIADAVLLVHSGFKIFTMSRTTTSTDHAWFESEKERFWKYLAVHMILLILLSLENFATRSTPKNIADFLKMFSAFVIFVIFAWKKTLTLFKHM